MSNFIFPFSLAFTYCILSLTLVLGSFFWEDRGAVHVKKYFLNMLKSHMWRKYLQEYLGAFALVVTIYVYWFSDLMQVPKN